MEFISYCYHYNDITCALVTRNVLTLCWCKSDTNSLMWGYMIGSPTRLSAQCCTLSPSLSRCSKTPAAPRYSQIIFLCWLRQWSRIYDGESVAQDQLVPTGLEWCRQQNTHLQHCHTTIIIIQKTTRTRTIIIVITKITITIVSISLLKQYSNTLQT